MSQYYRKEGEMNKLEKKIDCQVLCYNRFVTKKYKKRKLTDIIRFVKNKRKK